MSNQDQVRGGPGNATNRNDSYKRAKGGGSGNTMRNYNSLPRLGKERQRGFNQSNAAPPLSQGPRNDPETRSLGEQRLKHRQQRRGGQQGNDNCQMM